MYYTYTKLRTSHRKPSGWLSHTFENTYTVSYFSARTHWPAISNSVQFLPYRAVHIGTHTNIHAGLKSKVLGKCLTALTWAKLLHLLSPFTSFPHYCISSQGHCGLTPTEGEVRQQSKLCACVSKFYLHTLEESMSTPSAFDLTSSTQSVGAYASILAKNLI